jgi:hypothetical protein
MAKVITFSRFFPAYHPRKGEPTYFVEALLNNIGVKIQSELLSNVRELINDFFMLDGTINKAHTIRLGERWKVGDKFSPRVWSGKPYNSKQIKIANDIEIKKVWSIEMDADGVFYINGKYVDVTSSICDGKTVADNDGLNSDDLLNWFPVGKPFKGQVICWDEKINY